MVDLDYAFFTFMWPCFVETFFIIRPTRCTNFANLFFAWDSTCFGPCLYPSSGVHSLYTQQWYMSTDLYDIYHCWVYGEWTPDDGQRHCPKHV